MHTDIWIIYVSFYTAETYFSLSTAEVCNWVSYCMAWAWGFCDVEQLLADGVL